MAQKTNDPSQRYQHNIADDAFDEIVNRPDMQALDDQGDAIAHNYDTEKLRDAEQDLNPVQRYLQKRDDAKQPLRDAEAADWNDPANKFYKPSEKTQARINNWRNWSTRRKLGVGGGAAAGVTGLLISTFALLPLKIPGIMSMITNEAGQRVEQVTEHRAKLIIARAILRKFDSDLVVTGNGTFATLVASMRTSGFEKKLEAKGLKITKAEGGVRLTRVEANGKQIPLGGGKTLKNELAILDALNADRLTNKMVKDLVKEEIPSWRWMKRAKFAKWLRIKYGIPRYGIQNSTADDATIKAAHEQLVNAQIELNEAKTAVDEALVSLDNATSPEEKRAAEKLLADARSQLVQAEAKVATLQAKISSLSDPVKEMQRSRLSAESAQVSKNTTDFLDCLSTSGEGCRLTEDGTSNNGEIKNSDNTGDVSNALDDANAEAIDEALKNPDKETSKLATKLLTDKFASKAIPVIGWIDLAALINHFVREEAKTDFLGKAISGLKGSNEALLYGNWAGYGSQVELGAMRPDYISVLAKQTEGVEKAQAFNYIEGKTKATASASILGDTAYAVTASDIPGVPVDRVDSNNPSLIKQKMTEFDNATGGVAGIAGKPSGVILEAWYQTIGEGGLEGIIGSWLAEGITNIVPDTLLEWGGNLMNKLVDKLLDVFGLAFNPLISGPEWFNGAHGGATVSFNSYARETGFRKLSATQASAQNHQIAQERAEYRAQKGPLYALFSPDEVSSITSQLAVRAPTDIGSTLGSVAKLVTDAPTSIPRSLSPAKASAANAYVDIHGVDPYGATSEDLDKPLTAEFIAGQECPILPEGEFNACIVDTTVAEAMLCEFQPDSEDCAENDAATQNEGGGTSFKIATFNVLGAHHDSDPGRGLNPGDWVWRLDNSMEVITKKSIDIVGFQEFEQPQRKRFAQKMSNFELFPADISSHQGENSIAWDSSVYKKVNGGFMPNLQYFAPGYSLDAPWVLLEDIFTGQQLYVLNTHDPAHVENAQKRYENALQHVKFIKSLKPGIPVFFTGDFNGGYEIRTSGGNTTYQNDNDNLTYCILSRSGLVSDAYDLYKNRQFTCPNPGNNNAIDHIYISDGPEVAGYDVVSPGRNSNGSDHPTHIVDVFIPGSGADALGALKIEKVLTFVVENKSLDQMKKSMNYTFNLAEKYAYATNYKAVARPSLPNYIAIATGSDQGITSNDLPGEGMAFNGKTVFKQAIDKGKTAKIYAESMPGNCYAKNSGWYAPRHNPWTYVQNEVALCEKFDVDMSSFNSDVAAGTLPNSGLVVPNNCHNSHDDKEPGCKLSDADNWFKDKMEKIMNGPDWKSGKLLVVVTADEADKDDSSQLVLTVALHKSLEGVSLVSKCNLDHYSLSRLYSDVVGAEPLGQAGSAEDFASCFNLRDKTNSSGWVWPLQKDLKPGPCWGVSVGSLGVHAGMDINTDNPANPVLAMHAGTITKTGYDTYAGNYVKVKTSNGYYYIYQHLNSIDKRSGDVTAGEKLGTAGKTGRVFASSAAHFHFVVSKKDDFPSYNSLGASVNPLSVLPRPAPEGYICTK